MARESVAATGPVAAASAGRQPQGHVPYGRPEVNFIYNLLFCDDLQLFTPGGGEKPEGIWTTLLAADPDTAALRTIAEDAAQESRARILAYNRLRQSGQPVPPKRLLGVILEVGLEEGLDVLAAFADGRVRYINHSEKMSIFEATPPDIAERIERLLAAAQPVVDRIGPWENPRLPPPQAGMVRLTFLVSDGLYFGQGPYTALRPDPMAGPVLGAGEQLLSAVVHRSLPEERPD